VKGHVFLVACVNPSHFYRPAVSCPTSAEFEIRRLCNCFLVKYLIRTHSWTEAAPHFWEKRSRLSKKCF